MLQVYLNTVSANAVHLSQDLQSQRYPMHLETDLDIDKAASKHLLDNRRCAKNNWVSIYFIARKGE